MYFSTTITCAILAQTATVLAGPIAQASRSTPSVAASAASQNPSPASPFNNTTGPGAPIATPPTSNQANFGLSLTAQLRLADTAADRFSLLPKDEQFVFSFDQNQSGGGKGGRLIAANRKSFPALVGTGAGMAVGYVGPCGMNTLHVHPRGAELQLVIKGQLVTEMVPENGVNGPDGKARVIRNVVKQYQMTPFYQGSIHTQFNPDCTDAVFVAAFPSEDFGTGQIAQSTFAVSDDVIAATFGQQFDGADIDKIRDAIPKSIALGVDQCLQKCKIAKRN